MKKFIAGLLIGLGSILLIGFLALIGGTLVYWLWPVAIPVAFPKLAEVGYIAAELPWWSSVCLVWLAGLLIKSTNTNSCNS